MTIKLLKNKKKGGRRKRERRTPLLVAYMLSSCVRSKECSLFLFSSLSNVFEQQQKILRDSYKTYIDSNFFFPFL